MDEPAFLAMQIEFTLQRIKPTNCMSKAVRQSDKPSVSRSNRSELMNYALNHRARTLDNIWHLDFQERVQPERRL